MTIPEKSNAMEYTQDELEGMIFKMQAASSIFYDMATQTGCHPFIEFTGLMNEFIKMCKESMKQGIQFPFANTHTGEALKAPEWMIEYLWTKLDCIYGPTIADTLMNRMTGGAYPRAPIKASWDLVRITLEALRPVFVAHEKTDIPDAVLTALVGLIKALPVPVPHEAGMTEEAVEELLAGMRAQQEAATATS